jgi:hypothetical protein
VHPTRIHRMSSRIMAVLAFTALATVGMGYLQSPLTDEGAAAHIFQLSVVMAAVFGALFLATADWRRPRESVRPLIVPAVLLLAAFAALYYLEHFYYPAHDR